MGELGALFNPGMRHELEERQAKASRREEEGNARDGDLRIDLESGVAVINSQARPAESGPEHHQETQETSLTDAREDTAGRQVNRAGRARPAEPYPSDDAGKKSTPAAQPVPAARASRPMTKGRRAGR